jgi:hypothetical protein
VIGAYSNTAVGPVSPVAACATVVSGSKLADTAVCSADCGQKEAADTIGTNARAKMTAQFGKSSRSKSQVMAALPFCCPVVG